MIADNTLVNVPSSSLPGKKMFRKLLKQKANVPQATPLVMFPTEHQGLSEPEKTIDDMLRAVPELIREGVWVMEGPEFSATTSLHLSAKAQDLLGLSQGVSSRETTMTTFMSEEDKPNFRNFIRNVVSRDSNDVHLFKCRLRTADRRSEWFSIRAKYYSQEAPSRITGTLENISEEVEQGNRFDVISTRFDLSREMLNDGLWDLDIMNGDPLDPRNVFWWSPQFRNLLGFETVEEFPDVMDSWSSRLHPDDKQNALESFVRHLLDRSGKTGFDIEYRLKLRNREYRWFQARGQTRRAADGTPLRAVGALIDIQNRKDRLAHEQKEKRRLAQTAETANEIGKLVAENGDIAAQIKLISLNASIEAARAGIHGRGFSVIAGAIRSLAERTADITGQISRLQMRIKNSADEAGDR